MLDPPVKFFLLSITRQSSYPLCYPLIHILVGYPQRADKEAAYPALCLSQEKGLGLPQEMDPLVDSG